MANPDVPTRPVRSDAHANAAVAYLTDTEGRWDKLVEFTRSNPLVQLAQDRLIVAPNAVLVFGGDAIDRGPHARRLVRLLLNTKNAQPAQTVLLAGNRDLNKMRLTREMHGRPLARTPAAIANGPRGALMQWIMSNTMGAAEAFEHRRDELRGCGLPDDDESVVTSYLDDLLPGHVLCDYLERCQLAYRLGPTLFVHGAVTEHSLGVVPGIERVMDDVDDWVDALNHWCSEQIGSFVHGDRMANGDPGWAGIIAYQAPVPGTRMNQGSVVYGRLTDDLGDPYLPPQSVVTQLGHSGVRRIVLGHTPAGETPSVLRTHDFECIMADNSYGTLERGVQLIIAGEQSHHRGAMLDGTSETIVEFTTRLGADDSPVGLRDARTGHLIKGSTQDGRLVLYKCLPGYLRDHRLVASCDVERGSLLEPRLPATSKL